jgi:anti-anti-sigma factor
MGQTERDSGFEIGAVRDGAAIRIALKQTTLNYDVSDPLKSALKEHVSRYLDEGYRNFVLQLGAVSMIDSCGVGVLIALHHQVTAAGGVLACSDATPFVVKVLKMMRLDKFLQMFANEEKALKAVADVA